MIDKKKCHFCGGLFDESELIQSQNFNKKIICFDCVKICKKLLGNPGKLIDFRSGMGRSG